MYGYQARYLQNELTDCPSVADVELLYNGPDWFSTVVRDSDSGVIDHRGFCVDVTVEGDYLEPEALDVIADTTSPLTRSEPSVFRVGDPEEQENPPSEVDCISLAGDLGGN